MTKKDTKENFEVQRALYARLGNNLEQAMTSFLDEEKISYLNIYHRVKHFDSFYEKIGRKNYNDPFNQIEDICGVRIICYYVSDIKKIEKIIKKEFIVIESQDKSTALGLKEFAYRSVHYIVQIKDSWSATPNYRGLQKLKAEIQIRTVLMHAWAEVEHKLNYKSDAQVPSKFQRKLFRLSAKFEEADEQFEELREGINAYKETIVEKIKTENRFDSKQDLNVESYVAFLNYNFPGLKVDEPHRTKSFENLVVDNTSFKEMEDALAITKPYLQEIAADLSASGYSNNVITMPSELLGISLDIVIQRQFEDAQKNTVKEWKNVVKKWREKLIDEK